MSDTAESAATRLWRDRAQLREQERNEAQARARIAEEKVAILTAENDQLATEIARLRGQLTPDAAKARAETEQQIEALRTELLALLDHPIEGAPHERERARERTRNSAALEPGLARMAKVVRATDQL